MKAPLLLILILLSSGCSPVMSRLAQVTGSMGQALSQSSQHQQPVAFNKDPEPATPMHCTTWVEKDLATTNCW